MSKYVDAIGLKKTFCAECNRTLSCANCNLDYHFSHFPAADVRENVHGEWIQITTAYGIRWQCDQCEHYIDNGTDRNFCPNCGADMRGGTT